MTPEAILQSKLCSVLQTFHQGDFSSFKRACEVAGMASNHKNPFFHSNQFLAAQIGGLLEVSAVESSTRWWVAFDREILINSMKSKSIGTTEHSWFHENGKKLRTLIEDEDGQCLLIGIDCANSREQFFGRSFVKRLPLLSEIEEEVLVEAPLFFSRPQHFEVFNPVTAKWNNISPENRSKGLIRFRKRFGGIEHFIVHEELNLAFRIINAEWGHFLAGQVLGWDFSSILSLSSDSIRIPREVRLPNIIYRFLFANCEKCFIGSSVQFSGVAPEVVSLFKMYICERGVTNGV